MIKDYAVSFYFELIFDKSNKLDKIAFQEISGFARELSVEEVVCAGENRCKYKLPVIETSQNLVLKRALVPRKSNLVEWCKNSIGGGLYNKIEPVTLMVNLLNYQGKVCMKWTFHGAYPVKYSFSELKSQESGLLIESMELAYTYFDRDAIEL